MNHRLTPYALMELSRLLEIHAQRPDLPMNECAQIMTTRGLLIRHAENDAAAALIDLAAEYQGSEKVN